MTRGLVVEEDSQGCNQAFQIWRGKWVGDPTPPELGSGCDGASFVTPSCTHARWETEV